MTVAALQLSVPAEHRSLGGLRRSIRSYLDRHGADDDIGNDVELVVSELATNVVEHTRSETISVAIRREAEFWELIVADCDDLDTIHDRDLPAVRVATGRGLFIVQSLMDSIETVEVDGHLVIRCRKSV